MFEFLTVLGTCLGLRMLGFGGQPQKQEQKYYSITEYLFYGLIVPGIALWVGIMLAIYGLWLFLDLTGL
jgi:hypothetical protein